MIAFTALSDVLVYLAFSYLAGAAVLKFVPASRKPVLRESKFLELLSIAAIALFSLAPVIELTDFLADGQNWFAVFFSVLVEYRTGHGWLMTVLFCIILAVTILFNVSKHVTVYFLGVLILAVGYFSHVSTVNLWGGFISHSIHFLAMAVWAGVLLHVAWFAETKREWRSFLSWFTPFAIACVAILFASGIAIMLFFVEPTQYARSWVLPYGQLLLLKHLSIVPLLAAAAINGFLNKRKMYERAWLRVESGLLIFVFIFTAFMSKQAPPHNINNTFRSEGAAPFLEMLKGPVYIPIDGSWDLSINGILFIVLGLLLLAMMVIGYKRELSPWLSILCGSGFIIASYIGLMLNMSY